MELVHAAKEFVWRLTAPLFEPLYGGAGSILMFHRVRDDSPAERVGFGHEFEITSRKFEEVLTMLKRRNQAVVSLDELIEAMKRGRSDRVAAITFDDGYSDVFHNAFPVLKAASVPFTLYVTTGFPDRLLVPWTDLLEETLLEKPELTAAARAKAFDSIAPRFQAAGPAEARDLANRLFGAERVARAAEQRFMSWDQVVELSRHPLVSIGSHTVTHPILNALTLTQARHELAESKRLLEERLAKPVHHFAYPFGTPFQVGPREFELARECGYQSAVTTRLANVFSESRPECLPRVYGEDAREIELAMTGVVSAFRYRGRRVISE